VRLAQFHCEQGVGKSQAQGNQGSSRGQGSWRGIVEIIDAGSWVRSEVSATFIGKSQVEEVSSPRSFLVHYGSRTTCRLFLDRWQQWRSKKALDSGINFKSIIIRNVSRVDVSESLPPVGALWAPRRFNDHEPSYKPLIRCWKGI